MHSVIGLTDWQLDFSVLVTVELLDRKRVLYLFVSLLLFSSVLDSFGRDASDI